MRERVVRLRAVVVRPRAADRLLPPAWLRGEVRREVAAREDEAGPALALVFFRVVVLRPAALPFDALPLVPERLEPARLNPLRFVLTGLLPLLLDRLRPEELREALPPFLPPPSCLFTVAQARASAVFSEFPFLR